VRPPVRFLPLLANAASEYDRSGSIENPFLAFKPSMPLFKLRIEAADADAGRTAAGLLGELLTPEPLAVTLFEALPPRCTVEAYFAARPPLALLAPMLAGVAGLDAPSLEAVPDLNWLALSQAALPPIEAGRLLVHGSHDRARFGLRRTAIEIDAGEAFGTGHNPTTAGCLAALESLARRCRFRRVLDLGCGSGVLAIAAARLLPAAEVFAVDNDPIATAVARANARLNRSGQRLRVLTATGFAHPKLRRAQPFDLVLANILPRPLLRLATAMQRAIVPGGIAVLSGLLNHQAREVAMGYRAAGFQLARYERRGGWTILTLKRR
jgi:ribosomal protein L11 methyltransferase